MNININFFRENSPELFYIIGLWASDGVMHENRLQLQLNDYDVMVWLANTIRYKNQIKKVKNNRGLSNSMKPAYLIRFRSDEVAQLFEKYGVTSKKSKTLKFPNNIPEEYLKDYVRGIFDGDGCIYIADRKASNGKYYKRYSVSFYSGSYEFLLNLKENIEKITNANCKINTGTRVYNYQFYSRQDVIKFGEWIYQNNAFGMNRKKDKFLSLGINTNKMSASKEVA